MDKPALCRAPMRELQTDCSHGERPVIRGLEYAVGALLGVVILNIMDRGFHVPGTDVE